MTPSQMDSISLTVIEAIDPVRGRVVASGVFEKSFSFFLDGRKVVHMNENDEGEIGIEIHDLTIR